MLPTHRIGMKTFGKLCVQQIFLGRAPGARHPRFQVDNNLIEINHTGRDQWAQCKLPRCGITSRTRHQARFRNFGAIKFCEPVNRDLLQIRRIMGLAIPFAVNFRVIDAKISRFAYSVI